MAATEGYRVASDPIADFLAECCILGPSEQATAQGLWDKYEGWSLTNGRKPIDRTKFARRLEAPGATPDRDGHLRTRVWKGIGLRIPENPQASESAADVRADA